MSAILPKIKGFIIFLYYLEEIFEQKETHVLHLGFYTFMEIDWRGVFFFWLWVFIDLE